MKARRAAAILGLLAVVAGGTNLPVPLILLYQERFDLSASSAAALFGVYAAGLVPAVLVAGPMSDRLGPHRVMLAAGLTATSVSVGFAVAHDSLLALVVVRVVQGMAAGAVFTVGSAWLQRLWGNDPGRAARRAAVSMTAGFAVGSFVGGLWGEWIVAPLRAPFVLHAAACLAATLLVIGVPDARGAGVQGKGPHLRAGMRRRALLVVAPPALFVFGFPATAINAVPLLADFPVAPVAVTGILAATTLGAGAVAAPWQGRLGESTVPVAGALGATGMLAAALAVAFPVTIPVLLPGCLALGAGGGLALSGGLARLPDIAHPSRLGGVTAGFYAIAYSGFAVPLLVTEAAVAPQWSLVVLAALCGAVWYQQRPRAGGRSHAGIERDSDNERGDNRRES